MICVLSGGGVDCIALLGAFQYLECIPTHYVACSGGSLISALLISGYRVEEIIEIFSTDVFVNSIDVKKIDINKAFTRFGIWNTSKIFDEVEELIIAKLGEDITLSRFYERTKVDLTIVGSNVSTKKAVYFNHRTHGEMSLIRCLKISCNIPLLFQAVKHDNEYYVDGGLYDIFPYKYARSIRKADENIVGICVKSYKKPQPIENISNFFFNFSLSVIETIINNTQFIDDDDVYTLDTSDVGVDVVSFFDTKTEKRKLILRNLLQEGANQCERMHLKRSLSKEK